MKDNIEAEVYETMKIVGQISTPEEAEEIELIAKSLVIGIHARTLASKTREA